MITCNPLYRDHTLALSCTQLYFNTYIGSLCLAPAGWEKMQARKWYRGEVNEKNNCVQYFVSLGFISWFCQWKSKKMEEASLQVDGNRRGLFNLLLNATQ